MELPPWTLDGRRPPAGRRRDSLRTAPVERSRGNGRELMRGSCSCSALPEAEAEVAC